MVSQNLLFYSLLKFWLDLPFSQLIHLLYSQRSGRYQTNYLDLPGFPTFLLSQVLFFFGRTVANQA